MRRPFPSGQARFLKAFTEALFYRVDMAISPDQVVENIQTQFAEVSAEKVSELRISFTGLSLVLGGIFFRLMPVGMRAKRIEKRIQKSKFDLFQDMARLRGIVYAGYYGHWEGASEDDNKDNPVYKQIGFTLPAHRKRGAEDVPIIDAPNRDLHRDYVVEGHDIPDEVDVIVIGSGSGGSVAAHNIAREGHKVLILEAGPFYPSRQMTFEERRMTARLFKHGGLQTSSNNDFVVFQGQCVGGSSAINNGICLRPNKPGETHPKAASIFDYWAEIGVELDRPALDAAFAEVEGKLNIAEIEHRSAKRNGPHLLRGFEAWKATGEDPMAQDAPARWFRKNYGPPGSEFACAYCGYCNTGCPYGRKWGMAQSYLPWACSRHGARIADNAVVEEILWDNPTSPQRCAIGVAVRFGGGELKQIGARKGVVVAAGALASSKILRDSGFPNAGYNISLNIASPIIAKMPGALAKTPAWDEDQMATYVDMGDYLIESHFQPPMSMAAMMPGWFDEHARRMRSFGNVASAGILFPGDRKGTLQGSKLDFRLGEEDMPPIRKAASTLAKIHFAAGAEELYPALTNGRTLHAGEDIDAFFVKEIRESDDITLSSSHPHGGNPINADPAKGVVDLDCRVHGTANCYVTDASVMPSCIRVNAQLTTMAMAEYATGRGDLFS